MNYFEVKTKEKYTTEKGVDKIGSRSYIIGISAETFTAVDEFVYENIGSRLVKIQSIKEITPDMILNLTDPREDLFYYRCGVLYLEENDNTGKIKKVRKNSYVLSKDITEVKELVQEQLKLCVYEYLITSVNRVNLFDIILES